MNVALAPAHAIESHSYSVRHSLAGVCRNSRACIENYFSNLCEYATLYLITPNGAMVYREAV